MTKPKPFKAWMLFQLDKKPAFALMGRVFASKAHARSYLHTNQCPEHWYPGRVEVRAIAPAAMVSGKGESK